MQITTREQITETIVNVYVKEAVFVVDQPVTARLSPIDSSSSSLWLRRLNVAVLAPDLDGLL